MVSSTVASSSRPSQLCKTQVRTSQTQRLSHLALPFLSCLALGIDHCSLSPSLAICKMGTRLPKSGSCWQGCEMVFVKHFGSPGILRKPTEWRVLTERGVLAEWVSLLCFFQETVTNVSSEF